MRGADGVTLLSEIDLRSRTATHAGEFSLED